MKSLVPALLLVASGLMAQETPRDYLRLFDADGDGRISPREYVDYLSAGFHTMDADGDGVLDAGELPPGPRQVARSLIAFQADLRAQFRRSDRDHDGFLDARELAQPPQ